MLRDLISATFGFEQLSVLTTKPSKSLHRMLSPSGNLSMDNLAAIFHAIRARLKVTLEAHSVAARLISKTFSRYVSRFRRSINEDASFRGPRRCASGPLASSQAERNI